MGWLEQIKTTNNVEKIIREAGESSPVALACLYGMVADPLVLLAELLKINKAGLAAHVLLCTPLPPNEQSRLLAELTDRVSIEGSLSMIRALNSLSPILAVGMAQNILQDKVPEAAWRQHRSLSERLWITPLLRPDQRDAPAI